jgi:hypothetical protein
MRSIFNRNTIRWIIVISSFLIISLILWNTYVFFQHFKSEERAKMKSWTFAYSEFSKNANDNSVDLDNFEINRVAEYIVIDSTLNTPMLLIADNSAIISYRNIFGKNRLKQKNESAYAFNTKVDSSYVSDNKEYFIAKFQKENQPLILKDLNQTLYYGNSPLLNKLKFYPLALLLIIILFAGVVYFFYQSSKNAEQNKLWTGMAKETAHQIGTPLSSLMGWAEILKSENVKPEYITEIEKDICRLETITERFSKIGSVPELKEKDIVEQTRASFEYLKNRTSKLIDFEIEIPNTSILVNLNEQLFSWTIENLVKNGIDAMKGKGKLKLHLFEVDKYVKIQISDTGKGLHKNAFKRIFEPGFTTKKRGWGLGLSLTKRIIEEYHSGKITVLNSEIGKGTTFQISLKKGV